MTKRGRAGARGSTGAKKQASRPHRHARHAQPRPFIHPARSSAPPSTANPSPRQARDPSTLPTSRLTAAAPLQPPPALIPPAAASPRPILQQTCRQECSRADDLEAPGSPSSSWCYLVRTHLPFAGDAYANKRQVNPPSERCAVDRIKATVLSANMSVVVARTALC